MTHHAEQAIDNQKEFIGFDEREAKVIENKEFFEPYKEILKGLFVALGREDKWSDDPTSDEFISYLRSKWLGGEHGNSTEKDQFTPEQLEAAKPYLEQLGMMGEQLPAPGSQFDQTIIVGGTMTANFRRLELLQKLIDEGVDVGDVILLAGQRPREKRDGTNEELVSSTGKYAGSDITNNPRYEAYLEAALESEDPWAVTETDFGRIAVNKVMGGHLKPHRIGLPIVKADGEDTGLPAPRPDVPMRDVVDYEYQTDSGTNIIILNDAAIERANRPSRHTTKSSSKEWLYHHAPQNGARVLYITGNPHSLRTTQSTYEILQKENRGDIRLTVAGTAPAEGTPIQTYLGEVAAMIIKDVEKNYSEAA